MIKKSHEQLLVIDADLQEIYDSLKIIRKRILKVQSEGYRLHNQSLQELDSLIEMMEAME